MTVLEDKKSPVIGVKESTKGTGIEPLPSPPTQPVPVPTPTGGDAPAPAPKPKAPIYVANDLFLLYLEKVQAGQMKIEQFEPYGITETTPVNANDKTGQNFAWLCSEITKTKKKGIVLFKKDIHVKLKSALVQRIDGVVSVIDVKYDYKNKVFFSKYCIFNDIANK